LKGAAGKCAGAEENGILMAKALFTEILDEADINPHK